MKIQFTSDTENLGMYTMELDFEAICALAAICYEQAPFYHEKSCNATSLGAKQFYLQMKAKSIYLNDIFNLMRQRIYEKDEG